MIPRILYKSPPISINHEVYPLQYHIPEVSIRDIENTEVEKIQLRYYIDECIDGERGMTMYSVWFKHGVDFHPVMICHDSGRGRQDYNYNVITNGPLYRQMVDYLRTFLPVSEINVQEDIVNMGELDNIYGYSTNELYDSNNKPKYSADDIVLAEVALQPHSYSATKIRTRCVITSVNPYSKTFTYKMKQLDRRFDYEKRKVIEDKGNGSMHAFGNDKTVICLYE